MTQNGIDQRGHPWRGSLGTICLRAAHVLAAAAMVLAFSPQPAHAQFGRLKKLKEKFSAPDSAARAKDSLAQIAAGVKPESVKVGTSFLQKSASVVSSANGALESATGISAKDAALAATGIGAGNLVAKKFGMDPMSIGAQAIANAKMSAQQRAMQKVGVGSMGMPSAGRDAVQLQGIERAAIASSGASTRGSSAALGAMGGAGMAGFTQADAEALVAFQQEMMQLSMAASAGDANAKARLESWQTIALKYQPELQRLSIAASAGDVAAAQRIQRLQFDLMREWTRTGSKSRVPKAAHP